LKEYIRPFYLKWLYFRVKPEAKPEQWNKTWDYPEFSRDQLPPPVPGKPDIVILPMTDWHTRMQRAQHLAVALGRLGHRCFYLNPNLGREFPAPVRVERRRQSIRLISERVWEVHAGLPREPVFHHRLLQPHEAASVADVLGSLTTGPPAILCQFPLWIPVSNVIKSRSGGSILYDCHDLLSGFSRIAPEIIRAEKQLFEQADVVVFSAKSLLEKQLGEMPWLADKSQLLRNAVDVAHFPPSAGTADRKVIGYAGSLDEWFDVEAVEHAARTYPDCDFVLLGRIEDRKVLTLEKLPNVRLYGEIPYQRLPVYLQQFNVALIPFLVTPLTLATNPIKLYEYFSCGLPVVSSPLPEVELFPEFTYVASTPEGFAQQIGRALAEQNPQLRAARRAVAEKESWAQRAAQLSQILSGNS
jgi:glycosyltransferase involved in cell wall biosynthesis